MIIEKEKVEKENERFLKDLGKIIWRSDKKPQELKTFKEKIVKV